MKWMFKKIIYYKANQIYQNINIKTEYSISTFFFFSTKNIFYSSYLQLANYYLIISQYLSCIWI